MALPYGFDGGVGGYGGPAGTSPGAAFGGGGGGQPTFDWGTLMQGLFSKLGGIFGQGQGGNTGGVPGMQQPPLPGIPEIDPVTGRLKRPGSSRANANAPINVGMPQRQGIGGGINPVFGQPTQNPMLPIGNLLRQRPAVPLPYNPSTATS